MQKTVVIIGGPTAVGKTGVAIEVARRFGTEIISADSRQCFSELNIGVARPSAEELASVPHHFIASHSIHQKVTAATFEEYALEKAGALFRDKNVVVMTGGTGLYIKAFCEGFDPVPDVPEAVRQQVRDGYAQNGLPWLQTQLARLDPHFFAQAEVANPQRLMRALEIVLTTGSSVLQFRQGTPKKRDFRTLKIALELPKPLLHQHINSRVDDMMQQGLLDEVRSLLPHQHLNALQTVGYRELFPHLNGEISLQAAVESIKQSTRQYAKRQLTWFRKDEAYQWFSPIELPSIMTFLEENLS